MDLLQIMQLLHNIGIAWGVGGITANSIIMMKAEKNPELAPFAMKVIPAISKLVWAALLLLLISGVALSRLIAWPVDSTILTIKYAVVLLIVLNGINVSFRLLPKMEKLALGDGKPSEEFLKTKRQIKVFGMIGFALWYIILILSVIM